MYSDPLGGTPVAELTIAQDGDLGNNETWFSRPTTTTYTLSPGTNYAIAVRPTTANTLSFYRFDLGTGGANLRKASTFGTTASTYSRSDNAGAFGTQVTTSLPLVGIWVDQLSDDVSSGGINAPRFMTGGLT